MENILKESMIGILAKIASGLCALSFGASASGFIIGFASHWGFSSSAPIWLQGLIYTGSALIGINAVYRIWSVAKVGAPKGLKLICGVEVSGNDTNAITVVREEVLKKCKWLKIFGIILSFSAGTTYGGLTYLGISHIVNVNTLWIEIPIAILTIGSNFIASGALFSYAWIEGLNGKSLFNFRPKSGNKLYLSAEIFSACLAIFGLGCTMTLGSLGLAKSIARLPDLAKILGSLIALIGFFGEAPFAIKQGRLLVENISRLRNNTEKRSFLASQTAPNSINEFSNSTYTKVVSVLIYTTNSFAGTYTDIGNFSIPVRSLLASASAYLSLVTSLEEKEQLEEEKSLILPINISETISQETRTYSSINNSHEQTFDAATTTDFFDGYQYKP